MRRKVHRQLALVSTNVEHVHGRELARMSQALDAVKGAVSAVHSDLVAAGGDPDKGRNAMTADQVLRAMVIKQMHAFSYEELAFHLGDSWSFRSFCRFSLAESTPKKSTLQRNIKCVRWETWEKVNQLIIGYAQVHKIENGSMARTDCTVVETNIHEPTDSTLLGDCVRVLVRLMTQARELFDISFRDHHRRAKRRVLGILNAKRMKKRVPLYLDLIRVTERTMSSAHSVTHQLRHARTSNSKLLFLAHSIAEKIAHFLSLGQRVVDQATRRVLRGESVPSSEKIVSIFEPHTDIIVKDRRETHYGHKVCLTSGASGLVLDAVIERGNPNDSTLATKMIRRVKILFGEAPRQVSFDGGFSSIANVADIKALGVEDVAFSKHVGLEITDMVKSTWVFKKLRRFRAGIEATISFLKRSFGLGRCNWSGLPSFDAYVWSSVMAFNLLGIARRLLAT
jgi:IS5 family transposase